MNLMSDTIAPAFMKLRTAHPLHGLLLAVCLGMLPLGAQAIPTSGPAGPQADLIRLIEEGQAAFVVERLSEALAKDPGNIELANQLAVVLTGLGQVDRARQVLEQALLANPQAASGFQSLRTIAASQFAESYAKAMGKNVPAASKLTLSAADLSTEQVKKAAQLARSRDEERLRLAALETKRKAQEVARVTEAKPSATKTESPAKAGNAKAEIEQQLQAWAKAWATTDFDAYARFYAESFKTTKHDSRAEWLEFRKPRIVNKPRIVVEVSQVSVQMQGSSKAQVRFMQRYEAGKLKLSSRKSQDWVLEGSEWRIQSESN
ncbi:MAG: hypothetical protein RLY30_1076 [Pseudomonadota bacterium]